MRKLLKPLMIVGSTTILSRILGFIRDALMASSFGNGIITDAFIIAFKLPNLFRSLFAEGAFTTAFVPIYNKIAHESLQDAHQFAANILSKLALILSILSVLAVIFMTNIMDIMAIGYKSSPEKMQLTIDLARICFPYLLCICLASVGSSLLNSANHYFYGGFTPVLLNIVMIMGMVGGYIGFYRLDGFILAYSVFVAGLAQLSFIIYGCWRMKITLPKPNSFLNWHDKRTHEFLIKIIPSVMGAGVVQINSLISDMIATTLGTGAVSYLFYADRLTQLPLAILGIALGTIILQELSKNWAQKKYELAEINTNQALGLALMVSLPCAIGLYFLAIPVIQVLFERGAFSHQDTIQVAKALVVFAIALPFWVNNKVLSPVFFASGDTKTPVKIAAFTLLLNASLAWIFKDYWGFVGIAMASVICAIANNIILLLVLKSKNLCHIFNNTWLMMAKILILQIPIIIFLNFAMQYWRVWNFIALALVITIVALYYGIAIWIFKIIKLPKKSFIP